MTLSRKQLEASQKLIRQFSNAITNTETGATYPVWLGNSEASLEILRDHHVTIQAALELLLNPEVAVVPVEPTENMDNILDDHLWGKGWSFVDSYKAMISASPYKLTPDEVTDDRE